ncbi:cytochrome b5-like heme/steroid binding domain-containing protein, partial [Terfezia claveryi]
RKVILEPGHSPLDWARLCRTAPSELLRGLDVAPGLLRVTPSMLEKYGRPRKPRKMVWMALEGKVYNITAYIPFHPGGEGELLRAAGKDGTSLFMKTHSWVNVEGMLGGCLIGIL